MGVHNIQDITDSFMQLLFSTISQNLLHQRQPCLLISPDLQCGREVMAFHSCTLSRATLVICQPLIEQAVSTCHMQALGNMTTNTTTCSSPQSEGGRDGRKRGRPEVAPVVNVSPEEVLGMQRKDLAPRRGWSAMLSLRHPDPKASENYQGICKGAGGGGHGPAGI